MVGEQLHLRVTIMQHPLVGAGTIEVLTGGFGWSSPAALMEGLTKGLMSMARPKACWDQLADPGMPRQLNAEVLLSSIDSSSSAPG